MDKEEIKKKFDELDEEQGDNVRGVEMDHLIEEISGNKGN